MGKKNARLRDEHEKYEFYNSCTKTYTHYNKVQ
jgi:hypothetical protein